VRDPNFGNCLFDAHTGRVALLDFGASTLVTQAFVQGQAQAMGAGFGSAPPADLLFLQRKFAGTFMLCARLGARLDMQSVFGDAL
jgi:aarF domain-containing kinase